MACVTSRAFRVRGPSQPATMVPLVDMANHSSAPNARLVPAPGGALHLVALEDLPHAAPVLIDYGARHVPSCTLKSTRVQSHALPCTCCRSLQHEPGGS